MATSTFYPPNELDNVVMQIEHYHYIKPKPSVKKIISDYKKSKEIKLDLCPIHEFKQNDPIDKIYYYNIHSSKHDNSLNNIITLNNININIKQNEVNINKLIESLSNLYEAPNILSDYLTGYYFGSKLYQYIKRYYNAYFISDENLINGYSKICNKFYLYQTGVNGNYNGLKNHTTIHDRCNVLSILNDFNSNNIKKMHLIFHNKDSIVNCLYFIHKLLHCRGIFIGRLPYDMDLNSVQFIYILTTMFEKISLNIIQWYSTPRIYIVAYDFKHPLSTAIYNKFNESIKHNKNLLSSELDITHFTTLLNNILTKKYEPIENYEEWWIKNVNMN